MILQTFNAAVRKKIRAELEELFSRYRIFRSAVSFHRKQSRITSSPEPRYHGNTNVTADQTAEVAIHNVDKMAERQAFCEWIEAAVEELEPDERLLIKERYLSGSRVHDYIVYSFKFDPPISETKYYDLKNEAVTKLAFILGIAGEEAL